MKLIVQPRDGLTPLLTAIRHARKEVDIVIFRCDRPEIQHALEAAVRRSVKVHALIAHTNRGGEKLLRKLEQQLLECGATVSRTGDDFVRYHGKLAIVDRSTLFVLGFNYTGLDVNRSRSFGIATSRKAEVAQALRLFDADATRQPFEPGNGDTHLVISPENARSMLSEFIRKAKKQLLIYDPKVSDSPIGKLLKERHKAGVDVRIIGKVSGPADSVPHEKYPGKRLHVRAIIRDARDAFVGSQSLRKLELDERREVGIIVKGSQVVSEMMKTFEDDWALTDSGKRKDQEEEKDDTAKEKRATA
jgi:phosphatidylserine/phosphatidylglycerophosphate/cardiolipin synthase-like enzyme